MKNCVLIFCIKFQKQKWTLNTHTWPPPNTSDPILLRSLTGTQDANKTLNAGNVVPSPSPIKIRNTIRATCPPTTKMSIWILLFPKNIENFHVNIYLAEQLEVLKQWKQLLIIGPMTMSIFRQISQQEYHREYELSHSQCKMLTKWILVV